MDVRVQALSLVSRHKICGVVEAAISCLVVAILLR